MPSWIKRVRTIFRRTRMERELDVELAFHLDMLTADYMRRGMSAERARREARQLFGTVEHIKDDVRDTWLTRLVETVAQDIRYGARGLRKNLGYAFAVIVTMALGIGANSAIFSVVNAVVLRPLPYGRGEDLLVMRQARTGVGDRGFSIRDIEDIKAASTTLDGLVEYHDMYFILVGGEEPARVTTGVVSWDYFETLGVRPEAGRTFRASDEAHGAPATLLLTHEYWQQAFHGDPGVIGRVVQMNDRPHTVIGILPDVPTYPQTNDVYMPRSACPFRMDPAYANDRGGGMAGAIARRRPGVSLDDVRADLQTVVARLAGAHPESYALDRGHELVASPLRPEFTREFETTLWILLSTAGFVLLIVCASVANLSVARTLRRDQELALRTALGASRARLFRQLLTESFILAIAGGAAGLLLAFLGMNLLTGYAARFTTRASEIRIDGTVLLFTFVIALATGLIAGTLPSLSRRLGFGRPGHHGGRRMLFAKQDLRRTLIVAQVAASFMLLIGAGLMVRSLLKLTGVDPGFSTDHVLTMQIDMDFAKYKTRAERAEYLDRLQAKVAAIPGVSLVGAGGSVPFLERSGSSLGYFVIEGRTLEPDRDRPRSSILVASDDYFRAMNIPLVDGRFFQPSDTPQSTEVVIVNQSLARRYWPHSSAIGQRISGDGQDWSTIVGVVANVRQQLALEPVDEIYTTIRQLPYVSTNWAIRSTIDAATLMPLVRQAIWSVEPDQPIYRMRPLDEVRSASLAPPRLTAALLGLFALLALVITAAGIAGVIAFSVSQRTREFGVRVALGARRTDVVSMVVVEGIRLAATGLAIGVVGALILGGLLSTMLFGIGPTDGITYAAVSLMLLGVAALACLLPALRAASIDPMQALRAT